MGISLAVVLTVGLSIMGACSSDSSAPVADGTTPGADGGTAEGGTTNPVRVVRIDEVRTALKPLAEAECKWLFQCCNADERANGLGPAPVAADCADRVLQAESVTYSYYALPLRDATKRVLRELSRLGYGYDYGRVTIDAAAVQACAKSISDAACNKTAPKDHCEPKAPVLDDPCAASKLLVGKQQVGDECDTNGFDCAAGLFCQYVDGNQGVCLKSPKMGDTCFADQDCGDAVCDFATGKCVAGAEFGAACSFADPDHPVEGTEKIRCRSSLACDSVTLKCSDPLCEGGSNCQTDATCPAGTTCVYYHCGKLLKGGSQCGKDADCEGGRCRYDQSIMRQVCSSPAADGGQCDQDDDCVSHYCAFTGGEHGACTPQHPLNGKCDSMNARECTTGRCQQNQAGDFVCVAGPAVDDTCATDGQCNVQDKLFCVAMKCKKAPFDVGGDCTNAQQCKSEVCLASKCAAKGQAGATCGTAKSAPCDVGFYCDVAMDGSVEGTCKAKKPEGTPCTTLSECCNDCRASHGALRCMGTGPGETRCIGP